MKNLIVILVALFLASCTEKNCVYKIRDIKCCLIATDAKEPKVMFDRGGWYVSCVSPEVAPLFNRNYIDQVTLIWSITNLSARDYGYEITLAEQWNNLINKEKQK